MSNKDCVYLDPYNVLRCTECGEGTDMCQCVSVTDKAHKRLNSPAGIVMRMIWGELEALHRPPTHALAKLVSELGQTAELLIRHDLGEGTPTTEVLRRLVATGAMVVRVAIEGDDNLLYSFPSVYEEPRGPGQKEQDAREHR